MVERVVAVFETTVTDVREEQRIDGRSRWQLLLGRTEFRVGDGGALEAVARSGARLRVPVLAVFADITGELWHVVEKPLGTGTAVRGEVVRGPDAGAPAVTAGGDVRGRRHDGMWAARKALVKRAGYCYTL